MRQKSSLANTPQLLNEFNLGVWTLTAETRIGVNDRS